MRDGSTFWLTAVKVTNVPTMTNVPIWDARSTTFSHVRMDITGTVSGRQVIPLDAKIVRAPVVQSNNFVGKSGKLFDYTLLI